MEEWSTASLQTAFWLFADSLRADGKLCDMVIYVRGRRGVMIGYPAHKILLISASKYFKLLFEREDLRSYCHFPHLNEDGVFAVLNIVYGRKVPEDVNLEDAIMAARFLQIDTAIEVLEKLQIQKESRKRDAENRIDVSAFVGKRKAYQEADSQTLNQENYIAPVRLYKNAKLEQKPAISSKQKVSKNNTESYEHKGTGDDDRTTSEEVQSDSNQDSSFCIKQETDIDLTEEDTFTEQYTDSQYNVDDSLNYGSSGDISTDTVPYHQSMQYYDQQMSAPVQSNTDFSQPLGQSNMPHSKQPNATGMGMYQYAFIYI